MPQMDTRDVVEHHIKALVDADLAGTLDDYAADAVLIVAGGEAIRGKAALADVFGQAITAMFEPETSQFTLDSLVVEDECAVITWHMTFPGGEVVFGTDTFIVRNGKIVLQTGAAHHRA